jgi:hypothetical protein
MHAYEVPRSDAPVPSRIQPPGTPWLGKPSAWRCAVAAALLSVCGAAGATVYDNGEVNIVDSEIFSNVDARNSADGAPTTVITRDGAIVMGISVRDSSLVRMYDDTLVNGYGVIHGYDSGRLEIHGGSATWIDLGNQAMAHIDGGTFVSGHNTLRMSGDATAHISGGSFTATTDTGAVINAVQNSRVTITGGNFVGHVIRASMNGGESTVELDVYGGHFAAPDAGRLLFYTGYEAVTTFYGSSFNLPFGIVPHEYEGPLIGTLANGDAIDVLLDWGGYSGSTGYIMLVQAVPEPSTWALMLAGCAMLGGLARRKRGKDAARQTTPHPAG